VATALSPLMLPPPASVPRAVVLRPISASDGSARSGYGPGVDAEEVREEELRRLQGPEFEDQPRGKGPQAGYSTPADETEADPDTRPETLGVGPSDTAFLAQLMAQEEPGEEAADAYGDASRAYERFREEGHTGLFIDVRDPVDVTV